MNLEHIPHAQWFITGGFTLLLGIVVFWVKRWINQLDTERQDWTKAGGLVTRDTFFLWCGEQRGKCPACAQIKNIVAWKDGVLEDGGFMPRQEHTELCKEITKELATHFTTQIKEMFENHRQWVSQELKLITKEQEVVVKLLKDQIKSENGRWSEHDEQTRKT